MTESAEKRRERADSLVPRKVGVTEEFRVEATNRTFRVKRLHGNTWHLRDVNVSTRSRFGTLPEIRADVEYVLEAGTLPPAAGGPW